MTIKAVIRGNTGSAMVDGTWRNMSFLSKRNLSVGGNQIITRQSDYSMWAIRCDSRYQDSNGNWVEGGMLATSYIQTQQGWNGKDAYGVSEPLELYEFSDQGVERDPFGLNIRNELGILVFSTKVKPLRVIRHVTGQVPDNQLSDTITLFDEQLPSNRKYAVMCGNSPCVLNSRSDGLSMRTLCVYTPSSGRVTVKYDLRVFPSNTGPYRGQVAVSGHYSFQIIDVTGY